MRNRAMKGVSWLTSPNPANSWIISEIENASGNLIINSPPRLLALVFERKLRPDIRVVERREFDTGEREIPFAEDL